MHAPPGVRLTLITRDLHTPYSGMLPGLIAGHYDFNQAHIDLQILARRCGARLVHAEVVSIDAQAQRVCFSDRPSISYDILSLNIGSRPKTPELGDRDNQIAVKPVDGFIRAWARLEQQLQQDESNLRLAIVGAGAGGVELALSLEYRARQLKGNLQIAICTDEPTILSGHNRKVRSLLDAQLKQRSIRVYTSTAVDDYDGNTLRTASDEIPADVVIWATHADAPVWLADSGLALDQSGFIEVDACLRSNSHHNVFAAGDIASVVDHPRPKSGVFAVRQGIPLAKNIARQIGHLPLVAFRPQHQFLSLISTGDRYAVASRGDRVFQGRWCWRLKDWIDRRFVRQFSEFGAMAETPKKDLSSTMHCAGCGAKVGSAVLESVLRQVFEEQGLEPFTDFSHADDASLVEVPAGHPLLQSVDHFRAFVSDAYLFGRIAANHALGDLHAMGVAGDSALVIATVPFGSEANQARDLYQLMSGVLRCLSEHQVRLIGGHSGEAGELACGLTVNGFAKTDRLLLKSGLQPGDKLILTKPLGTGVLLAAEMRGSAQGAWVENALNEMTVSSWAAANALINYSASACTDVTGFGLVGHLFEMLHASSVAAEIKLEDLSLLSGALAVSSQGIAGSLMPQNQRISPFIHADENLKRHDTYPLLFDPQTAGGLLAGVAAETADDCVRELQRVGYPEACIIGRILPASTEDKTINLI